MIAGYRPTRLQGHRRRRRALSTALLGDRAQPADAGRLLRLGARRHGHASTVGTLEQAEQVSVKALQGEADTREVVDAVMSAEQALQAAVAIRDKIVSAYLEISRMAI